MRIGVLSDLHCDPAPAERRSWINRYEPEELDRRLDAALDRFTRADVGLVLLLGDLTERGDEPTLDHVLGRCVAAATAPVAAVRGNHDDGRDPDAFGRALRRHGVIAPDDAPFALDGIAIEGVAPRPLTAGSGLFATSRAPANGTGSPEVRVIASHFPVVSRAAVLARAGLPYSGDLVDRAEIEASVREAMIPTVVLSGHIHARCSVGEGPLLQLTVGALIEPPFDCTLVEIQPGRRPLVSRIAHRLGPPGPVDPVFTPADAERWRWDGRAAHPSWSPVAAPR